MTKKCLIIETAHLISPTDLIVYNSIIAADLFSYLFPIFILLVILSLYEASLPLQNHPYPYEQSDA